MTLLLQAAALALGGWAAGGWLSWWEGGAPQDGDRRPAPAVHALLGLGVLASLLPGLFRLGLPHEMVLGVAYLVMAGGLVLHVGRLVRGFPGIDGLWLVVLLLVLAALAGSLAVTLTTPPMRFDAIGTWWPKIVEVTAGQPTVLEDPDGLHVHPEYPRGLAWLSACVSPDGVPDARWIKALGLSFTLLLCLALFECGRRLGQPLTGAAAALIVGLHPDVARWSHSGYADLPVAGMVLLCAWGLAAPRRSGRLAMACVAAAGAASIKQEGAVLVVVVLLSLAWQGWRTGDWARVGRPAAWLLVLLPWWTARAGGPSEVFASAGRVLSDPALILARLDAVVSALAEFFVQDVVAPDQEQLELAARVPPAWLASWRVVLGCALILLPRGRRPLSPWPAVALLLAFAGVFLVTPHGIPWHVNTAFPRILLQVLPLMVLAACLRLGHGRVDELDSGLARRSTRVAAPLLLALLLLVPACAEGQPTDATPRRPNIVLFVADDHNLEDLGCYGNTLVETPHLDQLAADGLVLDNMFAMTAMCTPSRATLLTGLGPHTHGAHQNHKPAAPGTLSLPHHLRPLGYAVANAGKTHVGMPSEFPFQELPYGGGTRHIERFLDGLGSDQPFCLVLSSKEPHAPHEPGDVSADAIQVPKRLVATPVQRQQLARYYADVERVDAEVGRLLDLLESRDLADDTLFVYLSDNGAGLFAKWTCYDAGLHMPFIVHWPGVVRPGRRSEALLSFADVLPTLVEAAGGELLGTVDGRSFLPLLQGAEDTGHEAVFASHTNVGISAGDPYPIRSVRTATHRYIVNPRHASPVTNGAVIGDDGLEQQDPSTVWGSWRERARRRPWAAERVQRYLWRPQEELYASAQDPQEVVDLAEDPAQAELMDRLHGLLLDWMRAQGDPELEAVAAVR